MEKPEERPLERRASARTAVVWEAVRRLLDGDGAGAGEGAGEGPGEPSGERRVLDIGGGTGGFAVRVAELGHRVTVVDPSPDALAALDRRARERHVEDRVSGQQGDLAELDELVGEGSVDVVLCHEVLGLVDDPAGALATIGRALRPGGRLSLLVSQRHAAVLARAMAGHFAQARELLDSSVPAPGEHRFTADELEELLAATGFTVTDVHGVRVFADLVPSTLLDLEPGAIGGLIDLERAVAVRPEYRTVAAQLHVLAQRRHTGP